MGNVPNRATAGVTIASVATILAIVAIILAATNTSSATSSTNTGSGLVALVPIFLSIYDNGVQSLSAANTWTPTTFNSHLLLTNAWLHDAGTSKVVCNLTGLYTVYYSVQAQVDGSAPGSTAPWCNVCNLRYSIRGTQQLNNGTDLILEVPGSLTYSNGQNFFLAKQFYINATVGDVFRFQFISQCNALTLQPLPYSISATPLSSPTTSDTYPASTTLLIS